MRPDIPQQAVLRCGRCGRVAAWPDARLQVVCGCRARLELAPPLVREATPADRALAAAIFQREFGGRQLVADGQPITLDAAEFLVAETEGGISGALAWRQLAGDALHIIALATDPMWQRGGVGSYLLAEAELLARRLSLVRVIVTLSNDNIPAQYFYQRRGYRLIKVIPGAIAAHPRNAGLIGFANIPIADEIQLAKDLQS
jgi:ribosomal protein S18 acetylase RimI-like enzyme